MGRPSKTECTYLPTYLPTLRERGAGGNGAAPTAIQRTNL